MNEKPRLPTSEEVDRRLRIVSELRNLCLSLGKARRLEPPSIPPASDACLDRTGETPLPPEFAPDTRRHGS